MSSERLQHNLSLLKSLYEVNQPFIEGLKLDFPDPNNELLLHLTKLGVPQLSDYLVWIPFNRFIKTEFLGQGGFAKVWKAAVEPLVDLWWEPLITTEGEVSSY